MLINTYDRNLYLDLQLTHTIDNFKRKKNNT